MRCSINEGDKVKSSLIRQLFLPFQIRGITMLSFAIRHTASIGKTQIVAPVRTIVTCANHNVFTPQRTKYTPLVYQQKRTFLGPMMRYVTQFLASLGGTSIRAFFQAFQQAAGSVLWSQLICSSSRSWRTSTTSCTSRILAQEGHFDPRIPSDSEYDSRGSESHKSFGGQNLDVKLLVEV